MVAVGTDYGDGGRDGGPFVLRLGSTADPLLEHLELPPLPNLVLRGVASSPGGALWAFGSAARGRIALLRSDDGGASWADASDALPLGVRSGHRIVDLRFWSSTDGALVAKTLMGVGPVVTITEDGGGSWSLLEPLRMQLGGVFAILLRGTTPELLRVDHTGATLQSLQTLAWSDPWGFAGAGGETLLEIIESSSVGGSLLPPADENREWVGPFGGLFEARGVASTGDVAFVVGASSDTVAGLKARPAVYRAQGGAPATEQDLPEVGPAGLRAVDFADPNRGVACGWVAKPSFTPLCFHTGDGGRSWSRSTIPPVPEPAMVDSVVLTSTGGAWAAANVVAARGTTLLWSEDFGQTWREVPLSFSATSRLQRLARLP